MREYYNNRNSDDHHNLVAWVCLRVVRVRTDMGLRRFEYAVHLDERIGEWSEYSPRWKDYGPYVWQPTGDVPDEVLRLVSAVVTEIRGVESQADPEKAFAAREIDRRIQWARSAKEALEAGIKEAEAQLRRLGVKVGPDEEVHFKNHRGLPLT